MTLLYTKVGAGGLGIPRLVSTIPLLKLKRFNNISKIGHPLAEYLIADIGQNKKFTKQTTPYTFDGNSCTTNQATARAFADGLYKSVDGKHLAHSAAVPYVNSWVDCNGQQLSGADFTNILLLKSSLLPTPVRKHRYNKTINVFCETCRNRPASLVHMLQECSRSHGSRINRHDSIVKRFAAGLSRRGFDVSVEPNFVTGRSFVKPDLIATKEGITHVIDVCVSGTKESPDMAHNNKTEKYSGANNEDSVKNLTGAHTVSVGAFALTWNGIVSARSARLALELGLGRNFVKNSSLTALFGSLKCYRQYNKTTYGTTPLDYEFFDAE